MTYTLTTLLTVAVVLLAAISWVRRIRHPCQKPLAAYLIFVSILAVIAAILFQGLLLLLHAAGWEVLLRDPLFVVVAMIAVVLLAALPADRQARKPPSGPGIDEL